MPLFKCEECGCVENTAVCGYWMSKGKKICSECDPNIGEWHGYFEKKDAAESGYHIAEDGFLYKPSAKIHHTKLIGPVE